MTVRREDRRVNSLTGGHGGIHMGHVLPQLPRRLTQLVHHRVKLRDASSPFAAPLRAEQLLQPFVAQHDHLIGADHKLRGFVGHSPGLEQVQKILLDVAL